MAMKMNIVGGFARASAVLERKLESGDHVETIRLPENVRKSRVLIVGGAGVAGRNTAVALSKFCPDLHLVIGGRNREKGGRVVATLGDNSEFAHVDTEDVKSLQAAMTDVDVVVHAAGPFEYADSNVLKAAIRTKTAYLDICDHEGYSRRAKSYKNKAIAAGVPAITNGGFNPGVSNLMAAMLVDDAKSESRGLPERLRFNYFTAGSGGTGPGVLSTTFFLMADEAVTYHKGAKVKSRPYTDMISTDFGEGIGKKEVFLLNVPEVTSAHEVLGIPNISARFGTGPFFWNWTISAMIKLLPTEILKNKNIVQLLVHLSYPMIRAVDVISGQNASIKVDLHCSDGYNTSAIFSHKRLSEAAGTATAAFVIAVLEGSTKPGVWYPEEPEGIAVEARETLLRRASHGANQFLINKYALVLLQKKRDGGNKYVGYVDEKILTTNNAFAQFLITNKIAAEMNASRPFSLFQASSGRSKRGASVATAGERRDVVVGQGDKLVGEVSRLVVAEACIQVLDFDFTQGQIYEINSVEGEGPGNDPEKWEELFKAAQKPVPTL